MITIVLIVTKVIIVPPSLVEHPRDSVGVDTFVMAVLKSPTSGRLIQVIFSIFQNFKVTNKE
jgi:hypothetical protein